jgi:hypothetical protein
MINRGVYQHDATLRAAQTIKMVRLTSQELEFGVAGVGHGLLPRYCWSRGVLGS